MFVLTLVNKLLTELTINECIFINSCQQTKPYCKALPINF